MATPQLADPDVEKVAWDLEPLLNGAGEGAVGVEALLDEAQRRADAFAAEHAGKVAELRRHRARRGDARARRRCRSWSAAPAPTRCCTSRPPPPTPSAARCSSGCRSAARRSRRRCCSSTSSGRRSTTRPPRRCSPSDGLDFCRHHLRSARRYRPHLLSEPEERILAEKALTSSSAWSRLFEEQAAAIAVDLPDADQPVALEIALSRLFSPEREERRAAAGSVTRALEPGLRVRGYVLNTLLAEKMVDDRLRSYPHWLASRNLANEASDESVAALIEAVRDRYELPRRWYRLKAQMLGVEKLADYDRMASVTSDDESIPWATAREIVLDSFAGFAPEMADTARAFFDERRIDAPVRPGKRGGAFCSYTVPSAAPYVLLNYTARRRDVLTLAHELGHGVHAALARPQGVFHFTTPLTLAETASVFGETLVFGRLLNEAPTPVSRLGLLAESIEGSIATVFRQVAMNRFEHLVHTSRREQGELSLDRIGELWAESQEELLGDAVEVTDDYRIWWSYIPHFINSPGYVYAYAYGQLLALAVYGRYEEEGPDFAPAYLKLLSAGGSMPPEELGAIVGIDLADPGFWDRGLDLVERQLEAAEAAAREAGRI